MNKLILALVLLTPLAFAGGNNHNNNNNNCNGRDSCSEGGDPQGGSNEQNQGQIQLQGQAQGQAQTAKATGGDGYGGEGGTGGSVTVNITQPEGQANGQATTASANTTNELAPSAQGGNSNSDANSNSGGNSLVSTNGPINNTADAGDASAATGDVTVEGDTITDSSSIIYEDSDPASNTAAALFVQYCQSGMSGQTRDGGFSVASSDVLCDRLKMAGAMHEAAEREKICEPIEIGFIDRAGVEQITDIEMVCEYSEQGKLFMDAYYENLNDAQNLVDGNEMLDEVERTADRLFKPGLLIGLLVFLL